MEQFSRFGFKLKVYGEKEPKNHNQSSIDDAISVMHDVLLDFRYHDDELLGGIIETGDWDQYEMSRLPTSEEMFEIHKIVAKQIMDEKWDEGNLKRLVKRVCKDMKLKKV